MASVVAATLAGTTAAAMYLNGKHGITKDVRAIWAMRKSLKLYAEAERNHRVSIYYAFEECAQRKPNDDCIWSRDGCYTWQQAYEVVHQYAQWFLKQGVKPNQYVAFYLTNSSDFVLAWLGLLEIGAAPAMINYNLSGKALLHCLKVPGAALMILDEDLDLRARIEAEQSMIEGELGIKIQVLDEGLRSKIRSIEPKRVGDEVRDGVKGNWPMAMFFTSGTTGLPKGVPFNTDRCFQVVAARSAGGSFIHDDDRWYDCMPLYHGTGGMIAITMMTSGIALCIGKKFSTSKFWRDVIDSRSTWITYVGETARYLLAAPPSPLDKAHNVRAMYGNGLRPDVWLKFRERFNVPEVAEFFNSSEGVFGLLNYCRGDYQAGAVGHHGAIARYVFKNVYIPVAIDQVTGGIARDPKTGFAYRKPYEEGGEIIVAIPGKEAFAGYHKNPAETEKKFARDVFRKGDLYYRSGDALRRTNDGRWYFLDRLGDTFRWKGENVSTAEVSEVMGLYQGVVEANVYGVEVPQHDGRAGCAAIYIDPAFQANFDFAGLLRHMRTALPKYAVPIFIRVVKEMTPIHNNKQNKVPLRQEGIDPKKVAIEDRLYWISEQGKGDTYVEFGADGWQGLSGGAVKL